MRFKILVTSIFSLSILVFLIYHLPNYLEVAKHRASKCHSENQAGIFHDANLKSIDNEKALVDFTLKMTHYPDPSISMSSLIYNGGKLKNVEKNIKISCDHPATGSIRFTENKDESVFVLIVRSIEDKLKPVKSLSEANQLGHFRPRILNDITLLKNHRSLFKKKYFIQAKSISLPKNLPALSRISAVGDLPNTFANYLNTRLEKPELVLVNDSQEANGFAITCLVNYKPIGIEPKNIKGLSWVSIASKSFMRLPLKITDEHQSGLLHCYIIARKVESQVSEDSIMPTLLISQ